MWRGHVERMERWGWLKKQPQVVSICKEMVLGVVINSNKGCDVKWDPLYISLSPLACHWWEVQLWETTERSCYWPPETNTVSNADKCLLRFHHPASWRQSFSLVMLLPWICIIIYTDLSCWSWLQSVRTSSWTILRSSEWTAFTSMLTTMVRVTSRCSMCPSDQGVVTGMF